MIKHVMVLVSVYGSILMDLYGDHMTEVATNRWRGEFYPQGSEQRKYGGKKLYRVHLQGDQSLSVRVFNEGAVEVLSGVGLTYEGARVLSNGVILHIVSWK